MLTAVSKKTEAKHLASFLNGNESFLLFDFETTGLKADADYPIQLALAKVNSKNLEIEFTKNWLIKPPVSLPPKITEITGITDEMLADKPSEDEVFSEIFEIFGESPIVCGQNVKFDIGFLEALYKRQGKSLVIKDSLDSLLIAKEQLKKGEEVENHKLQTLVEYFYPEAELDYHDASADIAATLMVIKAFKERLLTDGKTTSVKTESLIKAVPKEIWGFCPSKDNNFNPKEFIMFKLEGFNTCVYYDLAQERWGSKDKNLIASLDVEYIVRKALEMEGLVSFLDLKEKYKKH